MFDFIFLLSSKRPSYGFHIVIDGLRQQQANASTDGTHSFLITSKWNVNILVFQEGALQEGGFWDGGLCNMGGSVMERNL